MKVLYFIAAVRVRSMQKLLHNIEQKYNEPGSLWDGIQYYERLEKFCVRKLKRSYNNKEVAS